MPSTYLTANTGTATNAKKFTLSMWIKRGSLCGTDSQRFYQGYKDGNDRFYVMFDNTNSNPDTLWIYAVSGGTVQVYWTSSRKFRDTNGWYHFVFSADSTLGTAADRLKVYVNGVLETSWTKNNNPGSNIDWGNQLAQSNNDLTISGTESQTQLFDGLMSHINFIDGTAYDATAFGSFDNDTEEWKINTSPSVTYGNNGYFILKDGNSVTDQSGEGNNFSVGGGSLTKTEDCPSNVFCTMNPLDKSSSLNLSYGNNRTASPSNNWMPCKGTIGMVGQNGKFYWEGKCESGTNHYFGVYDASGTVRGSVQSDMDSNRFVYVYDGGMERTITGQSAISGGTYATFGNNDYIGVALDKENGTITFYKNGTQIYTETHSSLQTKDLIPGTQAYGSDIQWNFGNGAFGNTQLTGTTYQGAGNLGIFKYEPPSGYTALCTKGLNQ